MARKEYIIASLKLLLYLIFCIGVLFICYFIFTMLLKTHEKRSLNIIDEIEISLREHFEYSHNEIVTVKEKETEKKVIDITFTKMDILELVVKNDSTGEIKTILVTTNNADNLKDTIFIGDKLNLKVSKDNILYLSEDDDILFIEQSDEAIEILKEIIM